MSDKLGSQSKYRTLHVLKSLPQFLGLLFGPMTKGSVLFSMEQRRSDAHKNQILKEIPRTRGSKE